MRCRKLNRSQSGKSDVIWFGSYGKNPDGTAKFVDDHESYSSEKQYVADAIQQKLSIIQGELFFDMQHGLPLLDKVKDKILIDVAMSSIILKNEHVLAIEKLDSKFLPTGEYKAEVQISTEFGLIDIEI